MRLQRRTLLHSVPNPKDPHKCFKVLQSQDGLSTWYKAARYRALARSAPKVAPVSLNFGPLFGNVEGLEIRSLQWSLIRRGGSTTKPVFYLQHAGRCDLRRGLLLPSVHWCLGLDVSTLNLIFNMILTKFKAVVFQAGLSGLAFT